jgi:hypothetical protein
MRINRASGLKRLGIVAIAVGLLSLATPAAAQYLTFVSATGNDANNCLVQASPCKTLQKAINVTAARGEVRLLSRLVSTGFINKSITIDGAGNTLVGAITINSASAVVTLRGLGLNGVGGYVNGVNIINAAAVHIEDCTVERYTSDGIKLVTNADTKLFILNTVSRDNVSDGLYVDAYYGSVEVIDSHFDGNANSGVFLEARKATFAGGSASGNGAKGIIIATEAHTVRITETAADDKFEVGFEVRNPVYLTTLDSAKARGNGSAGLATTATGAVAITRCIFAFSVAGTWGVNNQGAVASAGNNLVTNQTGNSFVSLTEQ